jgi:hypothetical protein
MMVKRTEAKIIANRAYNKFRRDTRYLGVNCYHKPVMVTCQGVADPWYISMNKLNLYHSYYYGNPDIKIEILV